MTIEHQELPDPEENFVGFVDGVIGECFEQYAVAKACGDLTPEYWVARSAERLVRLVMADAPRYIIQNEKETLLRSVAALPMYLEDFDPPDPEQPRFVVVPRKPSDDISNHERKMNMENQHRQIKGYRELNEAEIALMNEIKTKGAELGDLVQKLSAPDAGTDARWVKIGATHLQQGLMALTRSVAQPTFF